MVFFENAKLILVHGLVPIPDFPIAKFQNEKKKKIKTNGNKENNSSVCFLSHGSGG